MITSIKKAFIEKFYSKEKKIDRRVKTLVTLAESLASSGFKAGVAGGGDLVVFEKNSDEILLAIGIMDAGFKSYIIVNQNNNDPVLKRQVVEIVKEVTEEKEIKPQYIPMTFNPETMKVEFDLSPKIKQLQKEKSDIYGVLN